MRAAEIYDTAAVTDELISVFCKSDSADGEALITGEEGEAVAFD